PWMARIGRTWGDWGVTNGGVVFPLNPVDQARLLALGFHHLVNRLVLGGVQDADYLVEKLRPLIPASITLEQARRSHGRTADASLARVGRELNRARERQPVAT